MGKSNRAGKANARDGRQRKKSREVTRIPMRGGEYQNTLFPVVLRPDAEVRAEQEREVLSGEVPPAARRALFAKAIAVLEDAQRWHMDRSEKPHRYSWGLGVKRFYTAEEPILRELVEKIAAAAFKAAADRYRAEIESLVVRLDKQTRLLEQRRENGEMLAQEGRAHRTREANRRAAVVCRLYKKIRPSHPRGPAGNGKALREVCSLLDPLPGKDKAITVQRVRQLLKNSGIECR